MGDKGRGPRYGPLAELATRQHGVVTTAQLAELGFSRSAVAKATESGRLERLHRGVYAVGHGDLSWEGRCLAAVLACSPAVASHWTAAWMWGLLASRPTKFHLSARATRHSRCGFSIHSANLVREDLTRLEGIPVTSVERTVLDLAALAPRRTERVLGRLADQPRGIDLRRFESLLDRNEGHHGYGRLRKELLLYRSDPDPAFTRSKLEKRFRRVLRQAGLPLPAANFVVDGYELDCWWEAERVAVEVDTYGTHGSRRSFEEDRRRTRELGRRGIAVERVTDRQLDDEPEAVLAALAELLRRRSR
jgi:very-short-patch-repair endonuclease